jgi:hypothetical protein
MKFLQELEYKGYDLVQCTSGEWRARKKGNEHFSFRAYNLAALQLIVDSQSMFTHLFGF